jgi:hypothetical protein
MCEKKKSTAVSWISMSTVWGTRLLFLFTLLATAQPALAGKHPYAEFQDTVAYEVIEVLKKHGIESPPNQ